MRRSLLRCLFYVPLAILVLEHILGAFYWSEIFFSANTKTMTTAQHQLLLLHPSSPGAGFDAFQQPRQFNPSVPPVAPLSVITQPDKQKPIMDHCPHPLVRISNKKNEGPPQRRPEPQGIPRIVHQTSKSGCLTPRFAKASERWRSLSGWSYYFHDDAAVERLFEQHYNEFPMLKDIVENCLRYGTLKADVWRYLVLWVYGGIYVDLDAIPAQWEPYMLEGEDALFVVEQYHLLSQYYMAVTPHHPLMWYALQESLANLWRAPDTGRIAAALTTGPHALHQAYIRFRRDAGAHVEETRPGTKPVAAGHFVGTHNRSVTVIGVAEHQNQYIERDVIGSLKENEYKKLGMTFHQQDKKNPTGRSCMATVMDRYFLDHDKKRENKDSD